MKKLMYILLFIIISFAVTTCVSTKKLQTNYPLNCKVSYHVDYNNPSTGIADAYVVGHDGNFLLLSKDKTTSKKSIMGYMHHKRIINVNCN